MKPKLAIVYYGTLDRWGKISHCRYWLELDSARSAGWTMRGQHFFCEGPRLSDLSQHDVREFGGAWKPGATPVDADRLAVAWLTRGVVLTPTCSRCGMGQSHHVAPHPFAPVFPRHYTPPIAPGDQKSSSAGSSPGA